MTKLTCSDLPTMEACCSMCHHSGKLLNYYPFDVYGVTKDRRLLGVWLEYCCANVHIVKNLPIAFWTDTLNRLDRNESDESESTDYMEDFLT